MKLPRMPQGIGKAHNPETANAPLQSLLRKLSQNALVEFKIGFEGGEIRSKSDVQNLVNTIRNQYLQSVARDKITCLESIRIGWKLPSYAVAPILQQVVPMLLQKPARVQHLQLMMNSWAPLDTIRRLVSWHTLETLDIRSLRIRARAVSEPIMMSGRRSRSVGQHYRNRSYSPPTRGMSPIRGVSPIARMIMAQSHAGHNGGHRRTSRDADFYMDSECEFITGDESIIMVLPYISDSVKTLKLIDCDLQVKHMNDLVRMLRRKRHLRCLSLRHNRRLYVNGWQNDLLQKLPFLKALDLSICDLDPIDGHNIAVALINHNTGLEGLSMAGNYRLADSLPLIVDACATSGITELEGSFCDISAKGQRQIFESLATCQPCSLRSLKMQAMRVSDVKSLVKCIEENTSLERIILDHPREPCHISSHGLKLLLEAIRNNYYLTELRIDLPWDLDKEVLKEMEYWMALNRCGRSILVEDRSKSWPNVLANIAALKDIDTFHWILRRGAEQFYILGQ